jgi:potassium efflux system protein
MLVNKRQSIYLFALLAFVLANVTLFAQTETKTQPGKPHHKKIRHFSDSTFKRNFTITDTSAALIINRIEDINNTLNTINDVIEKGYDTTDISETLPRYQRSLNIIKYNISSQSGSQNLRSLYLLQDILGDMTTDLKDWQSELLTDYTELVSINTQLRTMSIDSTQRELPPDTALRFLYLRQTKELKGKWLATDTIIKQTLVKIDRLQSGVSTQYIEALGLQGKINNLVKAYSKQAFSKEHGYLWDPPAPDSSRESLRMILSKSVSATSKVLKYYLNDNWGGRIAAILLTILFFIWVTINLRKARRTNIGIFAHLKYIQSIPILTSLVFLFTLIPFLDLHPPAAFVEIMQQLLAVSLIFLLFNRWPKKQYFFWLILFALLVFHSIKGQMVSSTYSSRIVTFFVDLLSIGLGWAFIRRIKGEQTIFPRYMKIVAGLYIFLNILAVLSNLFGRVTLTQVFGNTAISTFVQAIGLSIFIQIILDSVYLQLEADKKSSRFTAYLNYQNVELRLRNVLTFIAGLFWFINLTQNLNVYDLAYGAITDFLNTPRGVGSTSFTLGSVLIFFFAIWVSNILQKYIGYFFGDSNDDVMPDKKTRFGTSILLIRLLVITGGFLLGILASGIPLDKVTIVIGALGVGIGLGLQNIVNNLVSGVILAIERPIQVGDLIEIAGNSGRVKDIGIRSSRIVTENGAEVIIPNGDMLSQKLTNWTLSNTHMRVDIGIKLGEGADLDKFRTLILGLLKSNENIMPKPDPQVLFRSITQVSADVQILFWAFDLSKGVQLKSDMLQKIYETCHSENIPVIG